MEKIIGNLNFDYDKIADVLYCSIENPRPAATMEPESGIVIRYDPEIKKIV